MPNVRSGDEAQTHIAAGARIASVHHPNMREAAGRDYGDFPFWFIETWYSWGEDNAWQGEASLTLADADKRSILCSLRSLLLYSLAA